MLGSISSISSANNTVQIPLLTGVMSSSSIPLFLWTETPNKTLRSLQDWNQFYQRMLRFVQGNRVNIRTTDLILRVLNPIFESEGVLLWDHPRSSPMFSEIISKLPDGVNLKFYPYLGDEGDRIAWQRLSNSGDPLEGAFVLASRWNRAMSELGCQKKFTAIVLDHEEFRNSNEIKLVKDDIVRYKLKYGIPEVTMSIGYDDVGRFYRYRKVIDAFYMQLYDIYTKTISRITQSALTSPYSLNENNPRAVIDFLKTEVLFDPDVNDIYKTFGKQMYIMWSTQHSGSSDCLYPLEGTCGANFEMGTWGPNTANQFLYLASCQSPKVFPSVRGHGLFQFNLIPTSWES